MTTKCPACGYDEAEGSHMLASIAHVRSLELAIKCLFTAPLSGWRCMQGVSVGPGGTTRVFFSRVFDPDGEQP